MMPSALSTDRLEQPVGLRNHRQQHAPQQRVGHQRTEEVTADLAGGVTLEDQASLDACKSVAKAIADAKGTGKKGGQGSRSTSDCDAAPTDTP